jgi:hypothetical protein
LSEIEIARQLIQTAYTLVPQITYFMLLLPSSVKGIFSPLSYFFEVPKVDSKQAEWNGNGNASPYRIAICERGKSVSRGPLSIRRSLVEDHDDLMPIFNKLKPSNIQDKFFLAKLLENQSEQQKTLAAEVNEKAVGMMSLSTDVNFKVLQESFYLSGYGNLMKGTCMYELPILMMFKGLKATPLL